MAIPAHAIDPVDGTVFYECGCDSDTTYYDQDTGEFQCVYDCGDGHKTAYSQENGRWSCICPAT
jgi:hypothetical protein